MLSDLRSYQAEIVSRIGAEIAAGRARLLMVVPTGAGKTVIAAQLVLDAVGRGQQVLFLAHRRELITQASRKLYAAGIDHAILLPGFPMRPAAAVQVASIATLHARAVRTATIELPRAHLIVLDEAHHVRARSISGCSRRIQMRL